MSRFVGDIICKLHDVSYALEMACDIDKAVRLFSMKVTSCDAVPCTFKDRMGVS